MKLKDVLDKITAQMDKDWEVVNSCSSSAKEMTTASIRYNTLRGVLTDLSVVEKECQNVIPVN